MPGRPVLLRVDSAFYGSGTVGAAIRAGAETCRSPSGRTRGSRRRSARSLTTRGPDRVPRAVFDETSGRWISRAEVAEIPFTAFASRPAAEQVPGRLVVRRIPDLNPTGQDGLFDVWRFHAFFTTTDPTCWTRWPPTSSTAATPSSSRSTPT